MGTRFTRLIRAGLLTPYFAFFESRFPAEFRASQAAYAAVLASGLRAAGLEVVESGLVDGPDAAQAARDRFAAADVDVVVAAATMAAPPTYGSAALAGFEGPIIVWDDHRAARHPADVDEVEATRRSGLLGSIMLANVLGREGRRHHTVSTVDGDAAPVAQAIRGAAAARALRGARLGLLGGIIAGYGDVVLDPVTAALLGIELVDITPDVVANALAAARAPAAGPLPWRAEVTPEAAPLMERSRRIEAFLEALVADARLDALALNCHSDVLRFGEELGAVGCLGASVLWARGVPVACTGDAATAVALMLATRIAGSAQYGEAYAVEHETGEMVISSCGMADPSLCGAGETPRLCANELYPGRHGLGVATRFAFAAGPATIVAFGPGSATRPARLVVSAGRLTGRSFVHMNGPSGTLTFDRPGLGTASTGLIDAGPAHHLALIRGDRCAELRAAASFLGVELVELQAGAQR